MGFSLFFSSNGYFVLGKPGKCIKILLANSNVMFMSVNPLFNNENNIITSIINGMLPRE